MVPESPRGDSGQHEDPKEDWTWRFLPLQGGANLRRI